jgi:hypothetical protein
LENVGVEVPARGKLGKARAPRGSRVKGHVAAKVPGSRVAVGTSAEETMTRIRKNLCEFSTVGDLDEYARLVTAVVVAARGSGCAK